MPKDTLQSLLARLHKLVKQAIRDCVSKGQPTDVEAVVEYFRTNVIVNSKFLLFRVMIALTWEQIRDMIQRDLKHTAVPVEEILEKERQIKLAEWPEFRGIPETISYHDRPGHVSYIRFIDTEKFHRAAALALLDENLAAVHQTREALARGDRFSDLLIARYGENPLWKLLQFWMEEGRPGLGEIGA